MSEEKTTTHDYDNRVIKIFGQMFFYGRTPTNTDVLDENERLLFNLPFVADERDVRIALYGWLERELRDMVNQK